MAKICIVIPTYNERDTIGKVLDIIFALRLEGLSVLIVDDNSPDGTGQLVDQLKAGNIRLDIIHRPAKLGLGPAYVAGFRRALEMGAEYIFEMDADLSHDPAYIPDFLAAIADCDLVLGSRYISGGGVKNWGVSRRLISRFGNIYARLTLGLPYHDLTGGFKCYRAAALKKIGLDAVSSVGYNFQIETTWQAHRAGLVIKEIPIWFTERQEGTSKFSLAIVLESFWKVAQLRFKK